MEEYGHMEKVQEVVRLFQITIMEKNIFIHREQMGWSF
ncbi:lactococcin 972 family bacteriocin [Streptococcus pneumoniae GA43380]|nr:lactococcin 972 family bacteriocin [Streptococcus pneumoniae GA43380]